MPGGYEGACAPGQERPLSAVTARALDAGVPAPAELAVAADDGIAAADNDGIAADNDGIADNDGGVAAAEGAATGVAGFAAEAACWPPAA
jgi:hypothetical protein